MLRMTNEDRNKGITCADSQILYILSSHYGGGGKAWEMSRNEKWAGGEMAKWVKWKE